MQIHWIWLAQRTGIKAELRERLLADWTSAEGIYALTEKQFYAYPELTEEGKQSLLDKDLTEAGKILDDCSDREIRVLTWEERDYPERLKNIYDPPMVLYYKGSLPEFDDMPAIGIVGTRHPGIYGQEAAYRLGYELSRGGAIVVSGMALGIDAAGMRGALQADGYVVGVLGSGVEKPYPVKNRDVYQDTLRRGCILSEYPPGTPPMSWNFPRRNRIISGLCCGITVVEAPEKSGSLITARLALDQGRDVFAVPGNINISSFVGSNRLLRSGAAAVSTGWDILCEYESQYPGRLYRVQYPESIPPAFAEEKPTAAKPVQKPGAVKEKSDSETKVHKKSVDKPDSMGYSDRLKEQPALPREEAAIVSVLENGECLVDEVIEKTGLPSFQVLSSLTMLEIKGIVKRLPGRRVSLK